MRLFTAIEIPAAIRGELDTLKGGLHSARWIDPSDYHLTLAFIGDVDAHHAADIDAALSGIDRHAFSLRLDGVGVFGGEKPRALWAGVTDTPALTDLQAEIAWALTRVGARPDVRKFTPHVTLARLKGNKPDGLGAWLSAHGSYRSPEFEVRRFALYSARPSRGGGPYVIEKTYPLTTGDADFDTGFDEPGADLHEATEM